MEVRQANLPGRTVGEATTWSIGQVIVSAEIVLDSGYGKTANYSKRRNTVCHELGHTLGLAHSHTEGSCMYEEVTATRYPSKTEIPNLNIMY